MHTTALQMQHVRAKGLPPPGLEWSFPLVMKGTNQRTYILVISCMETLVHVIALWLLYQFWTNEACRHDSANTFQNCVAKILTSK